ncbi:MAG TPA: serine hydrolase domain-containing protein [Puia sp.]|jgi:CubicO group peptidase (beta-lactamase class C family)|nr:serine hydrolase domain-containing protein [Puia sp.]
MPKLFFFPMSKHLAYSHFISILSFILFAPFILSAQQQKYNDEVEKKIALVENNLASEIQVEGEPNWNVKDRMKFYNVQGISIAVIKNYQIEWAKGFGWADSAEQRPITTSTLFQAGSISKSLNSVGVLKLAQQGKINLYTNINNYLTTWKFPYDSISHGKKITIANLLSHSAGLTVHGFPGYERGDSIPTLQQVLDGKRPANTDAVRSMFAPSLKFEYSGGGTTISQLIVEDITKVPYDKFMWENVLKPLGMTSSSYTQPPSAENKIKLATAYDSDGTEVKKKYHIYPEQAAAGLWTTPTDLAKYIIETQLSLEGKSDKVLSQKMTALRLTPYIDSSIALGVFIDTRGRQKYFGHAGQDRGFVARYWGSFNGGNGVVVMSNTDDISIVNEIINSVAIVYKWKDFYSPFMVLKHVDVSDDTLNAYAGQYQNTTESDGQYKLIPGTIFTITKQGHQLKAQASGQSAIDIYPESKNVFFPKTSDTDIKFVKDENGNVTKLIIHQNGKFIECKKIK